MRPRRRSKLEAKSEIWNFPDRILVDTSDYKTNNRPKLKNRLQDLIQQKRTHGKLYIEAGIGNGEFLNEIAKREPSGLFIGIELKEERIMDAIEEAIAKNIGNTVIMKISAAFLGEIFTEQQIDTIFMNFPDPWPKKRHIKNRMTSRKFIQVYETILKENGKFILKTDSENMFKYTLEQLAESAIKPVLSDVNLQNDGNNIQTQFERRYRKAEKSIFRIVAKKQ